VVEEKNEASLIRDKTASRAVLSNMPIFKANKKNIAEAAEIIKAGGVVAFPTETVYGLGANAFDGRAVKKIFALKGRPVDNPLIVHIADLEDLRRVADTHLNERQGKIATESIEIASGTRNDRGLRSHLAMTIQKLADKFWPGPLTLIVPKNKNIPNEVSAGLKTVAVRMPDHPVALKLIKEAGVPIAAPSANISGRPSPTNARHVADDFGEELLILDGGKARVGLESTVLDLTVSPPDILRWGAVTAEMIGEVLPNIKQKNKKTNKQKNNQEIPKAPGMKYRHYAPEAPLTIIEGQGRQMIMDIQDFIDSHPGKKIGVLASREYAKNYKDADVVVLGLRKRPDLCAKNLFSSLRKFDKLGVDVILAENFPEAGIGAALMERLRKAAITETRKHEITKAKKH